MAEAGQI